MEKPEINSIRQAPKFEENPFIESAIKEIESNLVYKQKYGTRTDEKGIVTTVDHNTGEVFQTSFLRRVEVDEDKFAKLYVQQLALLNNLSNAGIRVLGYLLTAIKPNAGEFVLHKDKCMQHCGYKTLKPVYKGLTELVNANIIARSSTEAVFFINPLVVFNGNRVVFATEYIKKHNPSLSGKKFRNLAEAHLAAHTADNTTQPQLPFCDD